MSDQNQNADANANKDGGEGEDNSLSLLNADGGEGTPAPVDFSKGKPEGFPDELWDKEKNAPLADKIYGKLTEAEKRAEGLRTKLAKGQTGAAPEKLEDYTLVTDKTEAADKAIFEKIPADDPLLKVAREAAKKAGLATDKFVEVFGPLAKEIAKMGETATQKVADLNKPPTEEEKKEYIATEMAKLGNGGTAIVKGLGAWKESQVKAGLMSKDDVKAFNELTETAEGVRFLNRLVQRMGAPVVPHDINVDDAAATADIEKKMSDAFKAGNEADYNKYKNQLLQRKAG